MKLWKLIDSEPNRTVYANVIERVVAKEFGCDAMNRNCDGKLSTPLENRYHLRRMVSANYFSASDDAIDELLLLLIIF